MDDLIEAIGSEMITRARNGMIEEVWRIALEDVVYIPLHHQVIVWAMSERVDVPIHPLNTPNFRQARLKTPE